MLAGELTSFGPNPWFGGAVWADDKNPDMNIVHIGQAGLGMPDRAYYVDLDEKGEARKAKLLKRCKANPKKGSPSLSKRTEIIPKTYRFKSQQSTSTEGLPKF